MTGIIFAELVGEISFYQLSFLLLRNVVGVAFTECMANNSRTIVSYEKKLPVCISKYIIGMFCQEVKFWKISASVASKIMNLTFIRFRVIFATTL